jgi:DNA-directed RNA polymerase subunit RPC12/RpoP
MAEILNFNDGRGNVIDPDVKAKNEALADYVWTCGQCGNSTFQLVRGGAIRCAHCNHVISAKRHFNPDENE